jgi:putative membrane protein
MRSTVKFARLRLRDGFTIASYFSSGCVALASYSLIGDMGVTLPLIASQWLSYLCGDAIMMILSKQVAGLSFAVAVIFSPALMAQSGDNAAMSAGGDAHFVMAASAAGDAEIIASRMAQTQGQSAKVKSFAATMIHDHTAANAKLRTIAQKDGFTLAGTPMVEQKPDLVKLQSLHGADFDKAYADMMRKDHQDAVTLFTTESSGGNNADLKLFATQTLPTLQSHLSMAQSL